MRAGLGQRHARRAVLLVANNRHENGNVIVLASNVVLCIKGRERDEHELIDTSEHRYSLNPPPSLAAEMD